MKSGGHDADDRHGAAIELNRFVDCVRVATKTSLPQSMTENHACVVAGLLFFVDEVTPELRLHAKCGKHVRGDRSTTQSFRLVQSGEVETLDGICANLIERLRLLLKIAQLER